VSIDISVSVEGNIPSPNFASAVRRANESVGRQGIRAGRGALGIHRKTGATSAGLRYRTRPGGVEWYDGVPQALFLEEGTRPHVIRPRRARALRWEGPSGPIFATKVNHPGTPAYHWLSDGINRSVPLFERYYTDKVMEELDG
jgi:hypothetical protein